MATAATNTILLIIISVMVFVIGWGRYVV